MVHYISSMVQAFTIFICISLTTKDKLQRIDYKVAIIVSLISATSYLFLNKYAIFLLVIILYMYLIKQGNSSFESLVAIIMPYIVMVIYSFILTFISENIGISEYLSSITIGLIILLLGIITSHYILRPIYKKTVDNYNGNFVLLLFLLIFVIFISNIFMNRLSSTELGNEIVIVNIVFMVIYIVITALIIIVYTNLTLNKFKLKNEKNELQNIVAYNNELEEQYNDMRSFRHDYQNILISFEEYIKDDNIDGLKDYFNKQIVPSHQSKNLIKPSFGDLSKVKVSEVKSIISSKLIKAVSSGKDVSIEVMEDINEININPIVLVRSLGIILDNAIEELIDLEDGILKVSIYQTDNSTVFVIRNSCLVTDESFHQLQKKGYSTKGKHRGLGLYNLNRMLSKLNNVYWEMNVNNNYFTHKITIGKKGL